MAKRNGKRSIVAMKRSAPSRNVVGLSLLALLTVAASAQWMPMDSPIPAFHIAPPRKAAPPLLPEEEWKGTYFTHRYQTTAYRMAAAIPDVIYQQPCFCWCSRAMGHKSLHSCFENSHGATCTVCMGEAAYAYQQTKLGKTPAEIRTGIVNGEWRSIDLATLQMEPLQPAATGPQ